MQFRRLFALMGLIFSLVLSLTVPAPAQKVGKAAKAGKLTAKLPQGKQAVARQSFSITPNITGCPSTAPIAPGATVNGNLSAGDCDLGDGTRFEEWTFTATAGQTLSVSMSAQVAGFDTFLILLNPDNTLVAENDDGGGGPEGTDSRIPAGSGNITVNQTGTYAILANGFDV